METNISFKDSLEYYKCTYYHFLDSFINSEIGDLPDKNRNFIKNILINEDIYFLTKNSYAIGDYKIISKKYKDLFINRKNNDPISDTNCIFYKLIFKYCI